MNGKPQGAASEDEGLGMSVDPGEGRSPFGRLMVLAAQLLRAPMAVVTFTDGEGHLVDGSVGVVPPPPDSVHVIRPLCEQVIATGRPLVVRDVRQFPQFATHPKVVTLGVKAYVGMPLRLEDGAVCGSFCVLEHQPRDWTPQELGILEGLAAAVMSEMALRVSAHCAAQRQREAELARAEAERVRARMEFLSEASAALASSLDYRTTLRTVTKLTVPFLADWCAVHLQQEDGCIVRLTSMVADRERRERLLPELEAFPWYPPDQPVGPAKVVRTGVTEVVPEVTDEWLRGLAVDERQLEVLRAAGLRSVVVAPLSLHGRTFGSLGCATIQPGRRYGPEDVRVVEQLADRVAVALDNAWLYRERDTVAQTLQRSLLPPILPEIPGLELAVRYRPAQDAGLVCGDFYDLFQIGPRDWMAAIGDVCGKGIQAAALTGLARHVIRTAAMQVERPSAVLRALNEALHREESVPVDARFCTAICLQIRPRPQETARITVSSGGHPKPVLLRRCGAVETVDCPGLLLGVFGEVELHDIRVGLDPGEAMVLFTDGVTEARRAGRLFTTGRLREVVAGCRGLGATQIAEEVLRAVSEWEDGEVRDDLAILVLRNLPG